MKKIAIICALIATFFTICINTYSQQNAHSDTITVVAVGDIMFGSIFPDRSYLPPNENYKGFLDEVKPYFNGDIVFCNMEGVLADTLVPECCPFCFGMPSVFANGYKDAGFNLISVGNNHANDFRQYGRENTAKILDKMGFNWAGYATKPSCTFTINGVKYGFCAFSPNTAIAYLHDKQLVANTIKALRKTCDIVIVSMHCGGEGKKYRHLTRQDDYYIEQNRGNAYQFAHDAIDNGADIVLGHGPHVTRAIEIYKGKFIAYSMGNFFTYNTININDEMGLAPIFRFKVNASTGNFISGEIISTYQTKPNKGPHIDPQKRVLKIIQELTAADIYDNLPRISNDGKILPPK